MENKKKTIFNVIFLLVVFTGTMYGVFHGEDIGEIVKILEQVNVLWLIPGVICVVVFIWGESIIIYYMMRTLKIRLKKWTCFLFSSVGFFFSCITPSASGGQPAQIYYMKKEKIPIPVSTLVLMIVTITYKLVLVVVGLWLVLFGQGFMDRDWRFACRSRSGTGTCHHCGAHDKPRYLRIKRSNGIQEDALASRYFFTAMPV